MPLRMLTASTEEIDEVDIAVAEILEQINPDDLDANSVGLIVGYPDFLDTGVMAALDDALPFDVIGMTAMVNASNAEFGEYRLTLTILTGDDIAFETAYSGPVDERDYPERIAAAYAEARSKLPSDPAMIIGFFGTIENCSTDDVLKSLDKACGGVPIIGAMSTGRDMTFVDTATFFQGSHDKSALAMVLVHGDVNPEFVVTSIPERNISEDKAVVTDSEGVLLKTINDIPAIEYLRSRGLDITYFDATTVPILLDYGDGGRPVAFGIYSINDDGSVITGGEMPVGCTITLGSIDSEGIIETMRSSLAELKETGLHSGLLMLPCVTRYLMLSPNQFDEMEAALGLVDGKLPYLLSYSGGEVCPVKTDDGKYHNRFHNYTFTACIF